MVVQLFGRKHLFVTALVPTPWDKMGIMPWLSILRIILLNTGPSDHLFRLEWVVQMPCKDLPINLQGDINRL